MLSHDLDFPQIPPATDFPGISQRIDRWQRQALTLWLVAQGFSLRVEIQKIVAEFFDTDHRSGALRQVISKLKDDEFLHTETLTLRIFPGGQTRFMVVCLADKGHKLVQDLGWQVYEPEWEQMQRLHEKGNYQSRHTAAVLAFVYQARLRGWSASVMPEVDAGRFYPDAVVSKDDESYYVEVELNEQKQSKWKNMATYQRIIALCARTPDHRRLLMDEVESAIVAHKCKRFGTDLRTLFEQSRDDNLLWIERTEIIA